MSARDAHDHEAMRSGAVRAWLRDRGLTLVLLSMFALALVGQVATGVAEYNAERQAHGQPRATVTAYLKTGHVWEALFENWESEFLQMAVFVLRGRANARRVAGPSHAGGLARVCRGCARSSVEWKEPPLQVQQDGPRT